MDLKRQSYTNVKSCADIPQNLPVSPNRQPDLYKNFNNRSPVFPRRKELEPYCPVDTDPFLPWIHDIFVSQDERNVVVIAQNKRRCNTGNRFWEDIWNLMPQVTIMQPISVKMIADGEDVPKALWSSEDMAKRPRFEITQLENADSNGKYTRFLCRFHSISDDQKEVITLSQFPIHYEYANARKRLNRRMLTPQGKDNGQFWLSNHYFYCPIPESFRPVRNDEILLDVIPIRTPPRFQGLWYDPPWGDFDLEKEWGKGRDHFILPQIKASGRWANLPVCKLPSSPVPTPPQAVDTPPISSSKPHYLVGCLWASTSYTTRGNQATVTDTIPRLVEWMEFHFLVGFDHVYIYDNSDPNSNSTLQFITQLYPASKVTYIPWPFEPCNNNPPSHENTGERSSQYAAEASCRARYGPLTHWMTSIDTDEYLIPMGDYLSLTDLLRDVEKGNTNVLSLRSTRSSPIYDFMKPYYNSADDKSVCKYNESISQPDCLQRNPNVTFLQLFNCEYHPYRKKPITATRARKQIYKPEYVLSHFVHYSTVTQGLMNPPKTSSDHFSYAESPPSERYSDENNEVILIHSKATPPLQTYMWHDKCSIGKVHKTHSDKCLLFFPWPNNTKDEMRNATRDGFIHNCWKNERVDEVWIPKLVSQLEKKWEECILDDVCRGLIPFLRDVGVMV